MIKSCLKYGLPLFAFLSMTPWLSDLDLGIERFFYHANEGSSDHFAQDGFFLFLYRYGPLPAQIAIAVTLVLFVMSWAERWKHFRLYTSFCLCCWLVGAVVITHVLFKDHWGRPRPKQLIEFGGMQEFRPYYQPNLFNQPEPSKSFPCGHCTAGFGFFSFAIVAKRLRYQRLALMTFLFALVSGSLIGYARLAQGGHFLSDVLFSAVIMWLTSISLASLFLPSSRRPHMVGEAD